MNNINEQLRQAYASGRRRALNEQGPMVPPGAGAPRMGNLKGLQPNAQKPRRGGGTSMSTPPPPGPAPDGMHWEMFDYCEVFDCWLDCDNNGQNCKSKQYRPKEWILVWD